MAQHPFPLISVPLTSIAVNYAGVNRVARGYIADLVAPRIQVPGRMFEWRKSRLEDAFTVPDTQISRIGQANEILQTWTDETSSTQDHALREPVAFGDEAAARSQGLPSLEAQAVRNVVDKVQLRREVRVAALAMSTSSYSASYFVDLAAGTKWTDFTNSDPVSQIIDAIQTMIVPGSVAVTSRRVMNVLRRHPKIAQALGGSQNSGRYASEDEVALVLGLSRIIVGNTLKQTSVAGQTLTTGQIWPDSFAIHYQGATGPDGFGLDMASPNFLTTFQWMGMVSGRKVYEPGDMGLWGGVKVMTGESVIEKQVAPYAGYLFANVL